jgi:hypothetical protein
MSMKILKKTLQLIDKLSISHDQNIIKAFTQQPPADAFEPEAEKGKDKLIGSDLFSLFTADIIKENKLFTR